LADSLAPAAVEPLLTGRLGRPYLYPEPAERLLDSSLPEGATTALEADGAAIQCSVLLRPRRKWRAAELSLVGAVAAAEAVEAALGLSAQIKWPNDVMVDRQRVASILVESHQDAAVLRIALDVNQSRSDMPEVAGVPVASLLAIDTRRRERAPLLADLLLRLGSAYDHWLHGGLDALYVSLGGRDFLRGRKVSVDGETGIAVAVDRAGRLVIDVVGERRIVEGGALTYER
jgi:biotin-(acetyl-CoA carboxylase) ligase